MLTLVSKTCAATPTLRLLTAAVAFALALVPMPAAAQDADAPVRLGPIDVSSALSLQTRYEDNVFHSAENPLSDTIAIIGARTDFRGSSRRIGVSASGAGDWVHFDTLSSERGANLGATLKLDFLFNRFVPYVSGSHRNTRERLNPEIDTRPRTKRSTVAVGSVFPFGGKTSLDASVTRAMEAYDQDATVDGVDLSTALDRVSDRFALSLFQEITPLTRLSVTGEVDRDQFSETSGRSADNIRLSTGFDSEGVVAGSARVGFRVMKPHDSVLSEARGFFAAVGTSITIADRVRFGLDGERDLVPSYRQDVAYYVSYAYAATFTYSMHDSLRLSGQISHRVVDYRADAGAVVSAPEETGIDREMRYKSEIRYQIGESVGVDFSAIYVERTSTTASRQFDGMSFGGGIRYGF